MRALTHMHALMVCGVGVLRSTVEKGGQVTEQVNGKT